MNNLSMYNCAGAQLDVSTTEKQRMDEACACPGSCHCGAACTCNAGARCQESCRCE